MSSSFMPHGMCFLWQPDILLLHVLADAGIALAYFSIPLAIVYFVRRRTDLEYKWVFGLFAAFIVACGITHLFGIWVIWNPDYWVDGFAKATTAGISVVTAVLLWPLLPKLLALPSPAQLRLANESLEDEIQRRRKAQKQLETLNRELERRVEERTHELERSNSELETFAYHASHDLKAPLRAVKQLAQWISVDIERGASEDVDESLGLLQSRVSRMETMLDDLLAYSRIGSSSTGDGSEHVRIEDLISNAVNLAAVPGTFSLEQDIRCPDHVVSRMPLQQAIVNLIGNSIKHHDRSDGHVTIKVTERADALEISVADDGPGIASEFHLDIFDMFRTLKPSGDSQSSGLGLTIVRKAVESVGGSIAVNSVPGEGCEFVITWPLNA